MVESMDMNEISVMLVPLFRKLFWIRVEPKILFPEMAFPVEIENHVTLM